MYEERVVGSDDEEADGIYREEEEDESSSSDDSSLKEVPAWSVPLPQPQSGAGKYNASQPRPPRQPAVNPSKPPSSPPPARFSCASGTPAAA